MIGYNPNGLTLAYGSQEWALAQAIGFESVIINSTEETVKRGSDGSNLFAAVNPAKDAFFDLAVGQVEISVSGIGGVFPHDLTVIVEVETGVGV